MGGYVALYAASKEPGLFKNIVTFATKYKWTPEICAAQVAMLDAEKIAAKSPDFVHL
jgi:hypothetical protein